VLRIRNRAQTRGGLKNDARAHVDSGVIRKQKVRR
jgi:hypothetical protein